MAMKLCDLKVGKKAILESFGVSQLHMKMLSMGVTPGQSIAVVRKLPLEGNLYIRIDGRSLAMRHEEAHQILVRI